LQSVSATSTYGHEYTTYLLVSDGESTLRLLIAVCECLELFDGIVLQDCRAKLHIAFRIFVARLYSISTEQEKNMGERRNVSKTYENLGVVGQRGKRLVQSLMHLLRRSFEKSTATYDTWLAGRRRESRPAKPTSNEERVSRKHSSIIAILEEITYTILRMTWRMQCFHLDAVSDGEYFLMLWCLRYFIAILTPDDWDAVVFELMHS
jgi:hypothetical protein